MRVALLTEGGYPHPAGESWAWCDRLVRSLTDQDFEVYALDTGPARTGGDVGRHLPLPPHVTAVHTAPPSGAPPGPAALRGRAQRRRFLDCHRELVEALTARPDPSRLQPDRFTAFTGALYGLADLAAEQPGAALGGALRSEPALRALEAACRARSAVPALAGTTVRHLVAATAELERELRPLSLPWYGADRLGGTDLCHATCGGPAALTAVVATRRHGMPLLVTEHGVRLRERHLAALAAGVPPQVRAVTAAFHRLLAETVYRQAALVTSANGHIRRWQERCGAPADRLRTIHPGLDSGALAGAGEAAEAAGAPDPADRTLAWVGHVEPAKDLVGLLHAFAAVRQAEPAARLRIVALPERRPEGAGHLAQVRALAAQLFPDEAADTATAGESPVTFEEIGTPRLPGRADAYTAGGIVVLSSTVEGFPVTLVEAMLCGRATVSTDVGAVREVIGGTGLVVPPRNPRALAEACLELLRDPPRRARLGAAARSRAQELFTVERNVTAFRGIYRDLATHRGPVPRAAAPVPFAVPAELRVPAGLPRARRRPAWAREPVAARVGRQV